MLLNFDFKTGGNTLRIKYLQLKAFLFFLNFIAYLLWTFFVTKISK